MAARNFVIFEDGKEIAIVRATSAQRAVLFITTPKYEAILADGDMMYKMAKLGFEIKEAESE